MKIKAGVVLDGLKLPMWLAIIEAGHIWKDLGFELVVTSGLEGAHGPGSLHPLGFAVDFRTRYFRNGDEYHAMERLKEKLGPNYDVVLEKTHIHCEYDHNPYFGIV